MKIRHLFLLIILITGFQLPTLAQPKTGGAEAYAANGERELAVKNYRRSLELDLNNKHAVEQLKKLDSNYK